MDKTYSKVLTIILIIIIVAILGLIGYLGYNYYRNKKITADASEFVEQAFTEEINEGDNNNSSTLNQISDPGGDGNEENQTGNSSTSSSNRDKRKKYKGFYVQGTINIPKTGCKYPILEKVTRKSLESSVAVIWPEKADLNQKGNVVIVGHNYRNGLFFSDNKKLSNGDKIHITDYDNKRVTYEIYKIFTTTDTDTSFYNRDTKGAREITLSTCTDDSSARLIIQAKEV